MTAVTEDRGAGSGGVGDEGGIGRRRPVRGQGAPEPRPPRTAWRVAIVLFLLVVGAVSVEELGDLTQTRPDHVDRQSRSEIVLEVHTNRYHQPEEDAARNLWAACSGTTGRRLVADPGFVPVGDHEVRFSVAPGLGEHAKRRLVGCLQDTTIDRIKGSVQSVRLINP
jgi:hypothetical protein